MTKQIRVFVQRIVQNQYMLWNGIEIAVLQNAIEKYVYVVAYTALKRCHDRYVRDNHPNQHASHASSIQTMMIHILYGYMAQWVHLPITIPLETWKTQIQIYNSQYPCCATNNHTATTITKPISPSSSSAVTCKHPTNPKWEILYRMIYPLDYHDSATTTTTAAAAASRPKKFPMNLYSGLLSSYIILCWKPAIQYTIYESIQRLRIQQRQHRVPQPEFQNPHPSPNHPHGSKSNSHISWMESFVIAIIARTIATLIVYPYIRRRLLQLQEQPHQHLAPATSPSSPPPSAPPPTTTKVTISTTNTKGSDKNNEYTQVTPPQQQHPPSALLGDYMLVRVRKCIIGLLYKGSQMLSSQSIRNVVRHHINVTSYYGIGPELIRGAISSVITIFVQEYILRLAVAIPSPPLKIKAKQTTNHGHKTL
jgi:hypothetical protein